MHTRLSLRPRLTHFNAVHSTDTPLNRKENISRVVGFRIFSLLDVPLHFIAFFGWEKLDFR